MCVWLFCASSWLSFSFLLTLLLFVVLTLSLRCFGFSCFSFYPLDPPSENVHLDYAHIDNVKLPVTPDVIILPSALKRFVRVSCCRHTHRHRHRHRHTHTHRHTQTHTHTHFPLSYVPPPMHSRPSVCICCLGLPCSKDVNGSLAINPGHLTRMFAGAWVRVTLPAQLPLCLFPFLQRF